ncbi:HrpE/YscL family type III secretion apparatus protein [Rugamonas sp. CCM 8940]|uniref:FliH/SctL family protein n=1 Tax=Rugamonas sp. CCM 8940 TaxID=2765359 RepID=UPI0018F69C94|nr:HrpE/YscL family type III secretion apparatus protein [Rugamonas sp. CCM 8940]MBJ7311936.1 flagellar biosynthesis/type III secretory pathway protein [Rugamonas sp. CCM 8940]
MDKFCVAALPFEPRLATRDGVWRAAALARCADAGVVADELLAAARQQAEALGRQAQSEARAAALAAEQDTLRRAGPLLQGLEQAKAGLLLRSEDLVIELAQALFERLVLEAVPRQRVEAALRRVLLEAPPKLLDACLRVHTDDAGWLPALDWEIKHDASLAPGCCRLEAGNGEWQADFGAAVAALHSALPALLLADQPASFDAMTD